MKLAATTAELSLKVRESVRFWLRVAFRRKGLARYRLRGSELVVHLRHGTVDIDTFDEIFRRGHYRPPARVEAVLRAADPLRVVDLGANVGLFDAYIKRMFPEASITAIEPHPANIEVLRKTIEGNGSDGKWSLIEACAGVRDGTVPFSFEGLATSRVEAATSVATMPAVDVFPLLDGADLVKIDIEGAEWSILSDTRFAETRPSTVALEYHSHECPADGPAAHAHKLLERAGYRVEDADFELPPGQGMLWAWLD